MDNVSLKRRGPSGAAALPVSARKLSHLVADTLRTRIANGELNSGDRLPGEDELLALFGVSRPTLREALRVVESEGLIRLGRGARNGALVVGPSVETAARYGEMYLASEKTTIGEVHEVRMLLEPSLVGLLAGKSNRAARVKVLRQWVVAEQSALEQKDYVGVVRALNEFHRRLVQLCENRALSLLAGILEGIPAKVYPAFLAAGSPAEQRAFRQRSRASVAAHARLVELLAEGDAEVAESFWRSYMLETAEFLASIGLDKQRVQAG